MKEIKAREGHYLADPNKENFYKAVKGVNVDSLGLIEVEEAEAIEIMSQREKEQNAQQVS